MSTFKITYQVTVQEGEQIDQKIEGMCLEQTAELPRGVLSNEVEEKAVGEPVESKNMGEHRYRVIISWPLADVGDDISQFLNILYGNISLQPGIKIMNAEWSKLHDVVFGGPKQGISEIRRRYDIPNRPLCSTALKPLGSSPSELADSCYQFALGGIDVIKDDHGLANQEFAPFDERVEACVAAIRKAADKNGHRSYYYPNITAFASETVERYKKAADFGADGVLICPHITGLETMHRLARNELNLPIIAHPAFSGGLTTHETQGLSADFLYGQLWRALGADFVIYPNKGGRFTFSQSECEAINEAARQKDSPFKTSFPMPAGGIKVKNVDKWISEYGKNITFLIGGGLYEHEDGIQAASEEFRQKLIQN
ncbi:MAG TPA: RuBisCO large subunit C-terminal-like domain-containing protein [Balneolaceae bacterium]|nr:RuBisCO large subunit C-terminal-like domain-containing protein [Balneolaceae bacterium]